MTKQTEALKLALDALEHIDLSMFRSPVPKQAVTAVKEALASAPYTNQCAEVCERAKVCAICAGPISEQEPVAWQGHHIADMPREALLFNSHEEATAWAEQYAKGFAKIVPLYTTPPQREWVGLTDEEIAEINDTVSVQFPVDRAKVEAIEAKLRSKNHG